MLQHVIGIVKLSLSLTLSVSLVLSVFSLFPRVWEREVKNALIEAAQKKRHE